MSLQIANFKPAQYYEGKESYVGFYVTDPATGKLARRKVKLNHIKNARERKRYGQHLAFDISTKLYEGWNPFIEEYNEKSKKISEAIQIFLSDKTKSIRPDSFRVYKSFCKIFLEWCNAIGLADKYCCEFEHFHAIRFLNHVESKNVSNTVYNNNCGFLFTLFSYFIERGWCTNNPFDGIKRKRKEEKIRTVIPHDARKKIIEYFEKRNLHGFVVVMNLCFQYLIRPKEILMLKLSDIDTIYNIITVRSDVAKNHKKREISISEEISAYFRKFSDMPRNMYAFSKDYTPGKKMLCSRDSGRTWAEMRQELELPKEYQFYSLKDTGITEMLENGAPAKYVKELADHYSLEMTEKYTHRSTAKKIMNETKINF